MLFNILYVKVSSLLDLWYIYIDAIVNGLKCIKIAGEIACGGPAQFPLYGLKIGCALVGLPIIISIISSYIYYNYYHCQKRRMHSTYDL